MLSLKENDYFIPDFVDKILNKIRFENVCVIIKKFRILKMRTNLNLRQFFQKYPASDTQGYGYLKYTRDVSLLLKQ